MRAFAIGLAAALVGTVAFAQTSSTGSSAQGGSENAGTTLKKPAGEATSPGTRAGAAGEGSATTGTRKESGASVQSGSTSQTGTSTSTATRSSTQQRVGTDTNVRSRVNVGIEQRNEGISVRRRTTVRQYDDEPSVTTIHRRRSVTSYEEPSETSRTVIKKKGTTKRLSVPRTRRPARRCATTAGRSSRNRA
jgi:hypothetical protein